MRLIKIWFFNVNYKIIKVYYNNIYQNENLKISMKLNLKFLEISKKIVKNILIYTNYLIE